MYGGGHLSEGGGGSLSGDSTAADHGDQEKICTTHTGGTREATVMYYNTPAGTSALGTKLVPCGGRDGNSFGRHQGGGARHPGKDMCAVLWTERTGSGRGLTHHTVQAPVM